MGLLRGCVGRLVVVVLLAAGGLWLWWENPGLLDRFRGEEGAAPSAPTPSPELADATLDRVQALQNGEGGRELRLGDAELTSLARHSLPGIVPPGVREPTVELRDGKVHLGARVALDAIPRLPALDEVSVILPDTVPISMRATLAPFDGDRAALHVEAIEASRVPLPARYIPDVLSALGRVPVDGLPANALLVPLPRGLDAAYVLRDSLVLVGTP